MEEETVKKLAGCVTLVVTLAFEIFVLFIVFKCGMDAGKEYYKFVYPAVGWTLGSVFSFLFGVHRASDHS